MWAEFERSRAQIGPARSAEHELPVKKFVLLLPVRAIYLKSTFFAIAKTRHRPARMTPIVAESDERCAGRGPRQPWRGGCTGRALQSLAAFLAFFQPVPVSLAILALHPRMTEITVARCLFVADGIEPVRRQGREAGACGGRRSRRSRGARLRLGRSLRFFRLFRPDDGAVFPFGRRIGIGILGRKWLRPSGSGRLRRDVFRWREGRFHVGNGRGHRIFVWRAGVGVFRWRNDVLRRPGCIGGGRPGCGRSWDRRWALRPGPVPTIARPRSARRRRR